MNLKTLIFIWMAIFSIQVSAQQDCECPSDYNPVCAYDTSGIFIEFPNECWADCLGFTVVTDSTLCDAGNPWGDCNCPLDYAPVCAQDSSGYYMEFSNACYAECFGFQVVLDSTLCEYVDPWDDCICTEEYNPVCGVDSSGYYMEFSNACYAECFGFQVVLDSTLCKYVDPWDDCICTEEYNPVCGVDSSGYYMEFSNACYAECFGFQVVLDSTLCKYVDPWDDCICTQEYNPVCGVDSLGNYAEFSNACYAACFGFQVVMDFTLCDYNPWGECDCVIDDNEPFICAVDTLGHPCYVPNACYAACWGLTVTSDSICSVVDVDPEIDWEVMECIDSLYIDENTTFQQALLIISESCGLTLPECIVNAPLFDSDTAFIFYVLANCDGDIGFNGNTSGSSVLNLFNIINNNSVSSVGETDVYDTRIALTANPINEQLVYQITSNINADIVVTLMDINGQLIFTNQISIDEGKQSYAKDVSQLNAGIYLLNLASGKSYQTVKVVITK